MVKYLLGLVVAIVFIIYISEDKKKTIKTIVLCILGAISIIVLFFVGMIVFFGIVWGDMATESVIGMEVSPNGEYVAYVVLSDQGALGADVRVYVEETEDAKKSDDDYGGKSVYWSSDPFCPDIQWQENYIIINGEERELH
ncbi:MAG: hypothetical protein IKU80_01505 [Firmicutes bacterium]|nr:hypothetical protein [Bacillota bacterium]